MITYYVPEGSARHSVGVNGRGQMAGGLLRRRSWERDVRSSDWWAVRALGSVWSGQRLTWVSVLPAPAGGSGSWRFLGIQRVRLTFPKHVFYPGPVAGHVSFYFILTALAWVRYLHFTGEEGEAQRVKGACGRDVKLCLSDSEACACPPDCIALEN